MNLDDIIEAIEALRVTFSIHGEQEAEADLLTENEIYHSVVHGVVIEDYPDDYPFPSCLIYGRSAEGVHIHSVWAYNQADRWATMVTVYLPDPNRWVDWTVRRRLT